MSDQQKPYTVLKTYKSESLDLEHYYLQCPDRVIHINRTSRIINQLDVDFIRRNDEGKVFTEILAGEYLTIGREVLNELGFNQYSYNQKGAIADRLKYLQEQIESLEEWLPITTEEGNRLYNAKIRCLKSELTFLNEFLDNTTASAPQ